MFCSELSPNTFKSLERKKLAYITLKELGQTVGKDFVKESVKHCPNKVIP